MRRGLRTPFVRLDHAIPGRATAGREPGKERVVELLISSKTSTRYRIEVDGKVGDPVGRAEAAGIVGEEAVRKFDESPLFEVRSVVGAHREVVHDQYFPSVSKTLDVTYYAGGNGPSPVTVHAMNDLRLQDMVASYEQIHGEKEHYFGILVKHGPSTSTFFARFFAREDMVGIEALLDEGGYDEGVIGQFWEQARLWLREVNSR